MIAGRFDFPDFPAARLETDTGPDFRARDIGNCQGPGGGNWHDGGRGL